MSIKIGITGGIGSGKSVVSQLLEVMGIPVYIADVESKRLTNTDPYIKKGLSSLLGEKVFAGGALNKPLLASYLFGHPDHARQINGIVGMESAILIESGFTGEVDVIVMVYAPLEIRIQRAICRDNSSRELIVKRIESQMSDEEKRKQADFVIVNDDDMPLIPQVLELISLLSKKTDYLSEK